MNPEKGMIEIMIRKRMYELSRLKTKPALRVDYDKYVSDKFCGHKFTDDELDILSYGDSVRVSCISKAGKSFTCEVMLKLRDGRFAWVPSFADDYGRTREEWLWHVHTASTWTKHCEFKTTDCPVRCERTYNEHYKDSGYWEASDAYDDYYSCPGECSEECPHCHEIKLVRDKEQAWIAEYLATRKVI